ncbi:MAG: endonuclease domain-containing protein [Patescibacteria group bacterium]
MRKKLTTLARNLRKNSTSQESKLWYLLRSKNFSDNKFRRQYPIGDYIVDFCCPASKLIIELDGGGHNKNDQILKDNKRDQYLKSQGFKILRVWNNEIDKNLDGVANEIYYHLKN